MQINIPSAAFRGFDALLEIGQGKLTMLVEELRHRSLILDFATLVRELAKTLEEPRDRMRLALGDVLLPLNGVRASNHNTAQELLSAIVKAMEANYPDWITKNREGWNAICEPLVALLAPNSYCGRVVKANELVTEQHLVAVEFKILTDLRPLCDEEATETVALLLTSTLVISYREDSENKKIHLALDRQDLRALREQIERAERKIELIGTRFQGELPVIVVGNE